MPDSLERILDALSGRTAAWLFVVLCGLSTWVVGIYIDREAEARTDVETRLRRLESTSENLRAYHETRDRYVRNAEEAILKRLDRIEDRLNGR